MYAKKHNGGAFCRSARVLGNQTATAGGAGDNTEVDGAWIDRIPTDAGAFHSAKLVINYTTTLAQAATLSFAVQMQDATDSSGTAVADYADAIAATVVSTGDTGGSTNTGTVEVDIDLVAARGFVRAQITPNLSAANTDTAAWSAVMILFGSDRQPLTLKIGNVNAWDN